MRDVKRIYKIMEKIESIWIEHPDLRLGQLISNVIDVKYLYEVEDDLLMKFIENAYKCNDVENHKGSFCIHDKTTFCQEGFCSACAIHEKAIC